MRKKQEKKRIQKTRNHDLANPSKTNNLTISARFLPYNMNLTPKGGKIESQNKAGDQELTKQKADKRATNRKQ